MLGGHTGGGDVGRDVARHHCPGTNASALAYSDVVDQRASGAYIYAIGNACGALGVGTDGGELANVDVVANHGVFVDDDAKAMLDVEAIAYWCFWRYEYASPLFESMQAPAGERIGPAFVL